MGAIKVKTVQVFLLAIGLALVCWLALRANAQGRTDQQAMRQQVEMIEGEVKALDKAAQDFRLQIEKRLVAIEIEFQTIRYLLYAAIAGVAAHLGTSLLNLLLRKPRDEVGN